jgi:hypothetical protein
VIAGFLLLAIFWLACRTHVRWGRADVRGIELAPAEEIWGEILAMQREIHSLEQEISAQQARARMN